MRSNMQSMTLEERLMDMTTQNEQSQIQNILKQQKDIDIIVIRDAKQYSLLHKATLNNQAFLIKYFLEYAEQYLQNTKTTFQNIDIQLKQWINDKTEEGFTCMHFASFRGNTDILDLLDLKGADLELKNNQGLNVLHIASQGDQPKSLCYFMTKNISFKSLDNKQGTCLHWASFLGYESSVNFLTSIDLDLNIADIEGLTPLHLGVISGNSRVVRRLLLRGSNRELRDNNEKLPFDIAKENEYNNIMQMLEGRSSLAEYCNVRPAFKPVKNRRTQLLAYIGFYLAGTAAFVFFNFPILYVEDNQWMFFAYIFIALITTIFFFISWLTSPGYLYENNKTQNDLLKILKLNDSSNVCFDCKIVRPARSRHCEICQQCVMVYDHHCPWINNCVGSKNHRYFICYVICMWLHLLFIIVLEIINTVLNEEHDDYIWQPELDNSTGFYVFKVIINILTVILCLFFFVPLTMLVWVQLNNFMLNKTTFERFNLHKKQGNLMTSSIEQSEQEEIDQIQQKNISATEDRRSIRNCKMMCCQNSENPIHNTYQNFNQQISSFDTMSEQENQNALN